MNLWRRGSLTRNPYHRTAFAVAQVPREVVRHSILVKLLGQTRRIVNADPQAHTIQGEPVTGAEINAAEQILLDPRQRIVEELLVHATEKPPLEQVRQLAREVAEAMSVGSEAVPVTNIAAFEGLAQYLVARFLAGAPSAELSFGALELDLVPPFGRPGED